MLNNRFPEGWNCTKVSPDDTLKSAKEPHISMMDRLMMGNSLSSGHTLEVGVPGNEFQKLSHWDNLPELEDGAENALPKPTSSLDPIRQSPSSSSHKELTMEKHNSRCAGASRSSIFDLVILYRMDFKIWLMKNLE
ncbi:hypothetical protein DPEC_G00077000 [Dallia pectoralis]|uniref:Uncharacterized protein n=1 Tax=Dallia pectoralis TaxID=75939 RepID=A0ACC2H430_DALPE|nr:hypothetical protein DPEC_G00077000 [Dallia pectoralis]